MGESRILAVATKMMSLGCSLDCDCLSNPQQHLQGQENPLDYLWAGARQIKGQKRSKFT